MNSSVNITFETVDYCDEECGDAILIANTSSANVTSDELNTFYFYKVSR
jgi:ribosomal protein L13